MFFHISPHFRYTGVNKKDTNLNAKIVTIILTSGLQSYYIHIYCVRLNFIARVCAEVFSFHLAAQQIHLLSS